MRCRAALTRPSKGPLHRQTAGTQSTARQRAPCQKSAMLEGRALRTTCCGARRPSAQRAARAQAGAGRAARTSGRSTTRAQNSARMAAAGSTNDSGTWASASRMLTRGVRTWLRARAATRGSGACRLRAEAARAREGASACKPSGSSARAPWRPLVARRQTAHGHARLQPAPRAGRAAASWLHAVPRQRHFKPPALHAESTQGTHDMQVVLADLPEAERSATWHSLPVWGHLISQHRHTPRSGEREKLEVKPRRRQSPARA